MKSITAGLCLSLLGGVALAQTPPAPSAQNPTQPSKSSAPEASAPQTPIAQTPTPETQATGGSGHPGTAGSNPPGMAGNKPPGLVVLGAPQFGRVAGQGDSTDAMINRGQNGEPEGEIIETPNGYYIVRPGQPGNRRAATGDQSGNQSGPMDESGMTDEEMTPPPRGRRPRGPMQEGKGARLHVHAPNLDINVKCPDDEPIKSCVDAVSQLLDKAAAQPRP